MKYCGQTNVPIVDNSALPCDKFISTDCIIYKAAIPYFGLPIDTTVTDVVNALVSNVIEYDAKTIILEAHVNSLSHDSLLNLNADDHLQYHTDARALTWLNTRSTDDLPEGLSNFYFTEDRVLNTTLTGFVAAPGTITDTDTVLTALQKVTLATGLEAIDEGNGIGYRIIGRDPLNFAPIGEGAVDFSYYLAEWGIPIGTVGAKGFMSAAFGENTIASGYAAFASGWFNEASGDGTVAMGTYSKSLGHGDVTFGYANTTNSFANAFTIGTNSNNTGSNSFVSGIALTNNNIWGATVLGVSNEDFVGSGLARAATDQIFVIGNGTNTTPVGAPWLPVVKSNAFVITRAGLITANSLTTAMIDTEVTGKVLTTKEWINTQSYTFISDVLTAPTSSTDTGVKGEIRVVGTDRYECIATDTWVKSTVIASF